MSEPNIRRASKKMGADFIPSGDGSGYVSAIRPGKEAHQTFTVDEKGGISDLHTTDNKTKQRVR